MSNFVELANALLNQSPNNPWNFRMALNWLATYVHSEAPVIMRLLTELDAAELAELGKYPGASMAISKIPTYRARLEADAAQTPSFTTKAQAAVDEETAGALSGVAPRWCYDVLARKLEGYVANAPVNAAVIEMILSMTALERDIFERLYPVFRPLVQDRALAQYRLGLG